MKAHEIKLQEERCLRYRALQTIRDDIQAALDAVTKPWPDTGPCGQGPFTGNTRESRQVSTMHIWFTKTRGGACAVDMTIGNMHIEAHELGRALEAMLRAKIETLNAEMDKI
jgi:hypothetical protein